MCVLVSCCERNKAGRVCTSEARSIAMATVSSAAEKRCIAELLRPERDHAGRVWVQGIVVEVARADAQGVVVVSVDDGSAGAVCMSVRVKDAVNPPPLKKGMSM